MAADNAIRALLEKTDSYPRPDRNGFTITAADLIEILQQSSAGVPVAVLDIHHDPDHDLTSVSIKVYATYARSELSAVTE
jgi:hypothetical protein